MTPEQAKDIASTILDLETERDRFKQHWKNEEHRAIEAEARIAELRERSHLAEKRILAVCQSMGVWIGAFKGHPQDAVPLLVVTTALERFHDELAGRKE